jgi:predicted thioesterase
MPVEPGLTGTAALVVADGDTAIAHRSGDVPALATPRVVALCEEASIQALADRLDPEDTSVGAGVQITHLAPSAVGADVRAEATLERIEGLRLHFTVSVSDSHGLVAAGKLTRAVVRRARFLEKLND